MTGLAELKAEVPGGVDVVLDVVGGAEAMRNISAVAPDGSIVQVGLMGGAEANINMGPDPHEADHLDRHHTAGAADRTEDLLCQRFAAEIVPLFESGALAPVIDSRFAFDDIADAHRYMESDANVGKILIDIA